VAVQRQLLTEVDELQQLQAPSLEHEIAAAAAEVLCGLN